MRVASDARARVLSVVRLSDPELVESNPGKRESCPILPCYPELSESRIGPGAAGFSGAMAATESSMPGSIPRIPDSAGQTPVGRLDCLRVPDFVIAPDLGVIIDEPLRCRAPASHTSRDVIAPEWAVLWDGEVRSPASVLASNGRLMG